MIKRKYVIKTYIDEVFCDECGNLMTRHSTELKDNVPYVKYHCVNKECGCDVFFKAENAPNIPHYIFDEENCVHLSNNFDLLVKPQQHKAEE